MPKSQGVAPQLLDFLGGYAGHVEYDAARKCYHWRLYFVSFRNGCLFLGQADSKKEAIAVLHEKAEKLGVARSGSKGA